MGCGTSTSKKNKHKTVSINLFQIEANTVGGKIDSKFNKKSGPVNEEEYKQELQQRGEQWDKYLKDKKNKNISKEMQIEIKMREENMRKAEELAKNVDGKFNLTVKSFLIQYKM